MQPTRIEPSPGPLIAARTAVDLQAVTRLYPRRGQAALLALDRLTLSVAAGERVAVVGPSGAGKTTLLELVCRLQQADGGQVTSDPAVLMPQQDVLLPWLSALDNAALGPRLAGHSRTGARRLARPVLEDLGLAGFEQARPAELSAGMRQRVAFARTLLSGRPVLCLDEPFAALDAITRASAHSWLERALELRPRTLLLVTHDVEEAVVLADRVLVLSPRPGRVVAELPVDVPRPRSRTDTAVVALREQALEALL